MDKDYFIQLTANLYRLTLLFPRKEPLRYKIRELADDILANLISASSKNPNQSRKLAENCSLPILKDLEVLNSFFEIAKNQNWVSPFDVLRIQEEYSRIKAEIKKLPKRPPELTGVEPTQFRSRSFSQRQKKILEILKEKGKAQVWELKQIFPEVSKRTLRRDFEQMLNQGLIERIGEKNDTFYQIKEDRS